MMVTNLFVALFAVSATAASLAPRDATTIRADVNDLIFKQDQMDKVVETYDGTGAKSASVFSNFGTVQNAVYKFGNDSQASTKPDSATCQSLIDLVDTTLDTSTKELMHDFIVKSSTFTSAGLKTTIYGRLQSLQKAYNNALTAFCVKCTTNQCAYAITHNYDDIGAAIHFYQ